MTDLQFNFKVRDEGVERRIRRITDHIDRAAKANALWTKGLDVAGRALRSMVSFMEESVALHMEQERATRMLATSIENMGTSIRGATGDMLAFADAIQSRTIFGDEMAERALANMNMLEGATLRFSKQAVAAMSEVASATGQDLDQVSKQFQRIFADPSRGMRSLTRYGITVSEAEREVINALVESGQMLEARDQLLQKVTARYQGYAEAVKESNEGQIQSMKNAWGDMKETIGGAFLREVNQGWKDYVKLVEEATGATMDIGNGAENAFGTFGDWAASAMQATRELARDATRASTAFQTFFGIMGEGANENMPLMPFAHGPEGWSKSNAAVDAEVARQADFMLSEIRNMRERQEHIEQKAAERQRYIIEETARREKEAREKAWKEYEEYVKKMERTRDRIISATLTPWEEFLKTVIEVNRTFEAGFLTGEQRNRGITRARNELLEVPRERARRGAEDTRSAFAKMMEARKDVEDFRRSQRSFQSSIVGLTGLWNTIQTSAASIDEDDKQLEELQNARKDAERRWREEKTQWQRSHELLRRLEFRATGTATFAR